MPAVSIVLPTYNRAKFLPNAFASIQKQTFTDWELIVVDDGSTDNTRELVAELSKTAKGPVRYIFQANQGAYGARNIGLTHAQGDYIAFFDSDDLWLSHHLQDCVRSFQASPEVDWVYGSCRVVDYNSGHVTSPSTFYVNGKARPFLGLEARQAGDLRIITDANVIRCMLLDGLYCGLQNSVIKRHLFEHQRFHDAFRNEAEDQLVVLRLLSEGRRFGYIDQVHVVYHEHESNSSAAGCDSNLEKHLTIYRALIRGFEELRHQINMKPSDLRAWRQRVSREYFWHLGYSLFWRNGRRNEALGAYWQGMRLWPWDIAYWKTYLLARMRSAPSP
jgi:glycosyltransferase involved in cell wall biosynthesis